ncbi:polysaccharide deacetylase family protein [Paenibacillus allorhizosphaerae]|uniref:NodB homology domain-containing protein n=1 Tax=Paenibacillus allorhizosphaerae TaxID=2849866 RepID=A0ABN7TTH1_9BACL|nr:polysaccharide deacetylase family protein [Paenibacillus allorhizosphaerae]CAG7650503.1 hypothetical protein PAECIP111802_04737 [Paenibacillus allorhizosphaerae]
MKKTARSFILTATIAALLVSCSSNREQAAQVSKDTPGHSVNNQVHPPDPVIPSPPATSINTETPKDDKAKEPPMKEPVQEPAKEPSKEPVKTAPAQTATSSVYGGSKESSKSDPGNRKELSWYYMKKKKGQVPDFPHETKSFTKDMKALWVGTGKKVYLTIDTGGPLGDTATLVKSLKDNDAKANFFIAGYNVKKDPDFVRTLVADGHLVANHTMTHTDMNLQTDEQIRKEIQDYEKLYKEVTGKDIQPYFRFPYGKYNTHILKLVSDMGYSSVFWSTAMRDWEPRKNGAEDPYNDIMNNLHDGNIILMHQGSPENIEALDRIIKAVKKAGYEFALLTDIDPPK